MYRILAVNLDGALLSSKRKIHKDTKSLLRRVVYKGIDVVFFTSQSFQFAHYIRKQFPCSVSFISNLGSIFVNNQKETLVFDRISNWETTDIVHLLENMDCQIRLIHENKIIANTFFANRNDGTKIKWDKNDYAFYIQQYVDYLSEYCVVEEINPLQIEVYFANDIDVVDAIKGIKSIANVNILHQAHLHKIIIMPKKINLLSTFSYVLKKRNIMWSDVVVVGCNDLDISLMDNAGLSVATANSSIETKKYADWVTRSNDNFGLNYVVHEVFRHQQPMHLLKKIKK